MAQDGPDEARIAPSWPTKAPEIAPRWGKLGQDGPRLPQNWSKKLQNQSRWTKMSPVTIQHGKSQPSNYQQPGTGRRSQEQPRTARRSQELPGASITSFGEYISSSSSFFITLLCLGGVFALIFFCYRLVFASFCFTLALLLCCLCFPNGGDPRSYCIYIYIYV